MNTEGIIVSIVILAVVCILGYAISQVNSVFRR